jgi:hypothetical protein
LFPTKPRELSPSRFFFSKVTAPRDERLDKDIDEVVSTLLAYTQPQLDHPLEPSGNIPKDRQKTLGGSS